MFSLTVPTNIKIAHDPKRGFKGNSLQALPEMMKRKEEWERTKGVQETPFGTFDLSQMKVYVDGKKVSPRWDF